MGPRMKLKNWRTNLKNVFESAKDVDFKYGKFDCVLFVADCIEVMYGIDLASDYRNSYATGASSRRILKNFGVTSLADLFILFLGEPSKNSWIFCGLGNPCIIKYGKTEFCGVCDGHSVLAVGQKGLVAHDKNKIHKYWEL